ARWGSTGVGGVRVRPPIPDLPEPLRGRKFVVVEAIHLGDAGDGAALLQPLRDLQPEIDTTGVIPIGALSKVHIDPEPPVPGSGDGFLLDELPAEAIDALAARAAAGELDTLLSVELRQLGGAGPRRQARTGTL